MSVAFNVVLSWDTIRAIQAGELASVLQQPGNVWSGSYRPIHDIACNVVSTVNAMPFNITPKANPADTSGPFIGFSTMGLDDVVQGPLCPSSPAPPTPISGPTTFNGGWECEEIEEFIVRDLMNKEEHFSGFGADSMILDVAYEFEERTGLEGSAISFTFNNCELSMHTQLKSLNIRKGAIIVVKPKKNANAVADQDVVVIIRDTMKREHTVVVKSTSSVHHLICMYGDITGLRTVDLRFFFGAQGYHVSCALSENNLAEEGITTGSILQVAPSQEVTLIFRDQMLNEKNVTVRDHQSLADFVANYEVEVDGHRKFKYSAHDGCMFPPSQSYPKLEDLDLSDGAVVNVHPLQTNAKVARAESVASLATGFSDRTRDHSDVWDYCPDKSFCLE